MVNEKRHYTLDNHVGESELNKGHLVTFEAGEHDDVCIAGSFNNWERWAMERDGNVFHKTIFSEGDFEFKFIVNGNWVCSSSKPTNSNSNHDAKIHY